MHTLYNIYANVVLYICKRYIIYMQTLYCTYANVILYYSCKRYTTYVCTSTCRIGHLQGWPELHICTVYDRISGDFPAKNTVYTPYIYGSGRAHSPAIVQPLTPAV
jgi:hypothetical protein